MVQRGMVDELMRSKVIWECTQCHQCMERCPRGVTPFDIIIQLQNMAVKNGLPHPESLDQILATIERTGSVQGSQEIFDSEFEGYRREDLGLPELVGPLDLKAFKRAVEESARW
jgi:heterodisulfide reductase subunit C